MHTCTRFESGYLVSKKWYVVWSGKQPGIYTNWEDAKTQVHGFAGARFKSYKQKEDAEHAYRIGPDSTPIDACKTIVPDHVLHSISVDAACSGNPGLVEYQGVYTDTQTVIFHRKIDGFGTNNLGEFLAIIHAIQWLDQQGESMPIYTDSGTAMAWIRRKYVNTSLQKGSKTAPILNDVTDAIEWLRGYNGTYNLQKWDTKSWGEIRADFGRK